MGALVTHDDAMQRLLLDLRQEQEITRRMADRLDRRPPSHDEAGPQGRG